ncbi:MAG: outer membrane beta-barrel protein [Prevotellaceae bacterium]|jgi:hypothetical protein|nr:outer membrane beta-barrel protein [Prevotellaceae bacterium]
MRKLVTLSVALLIVCHPAFSQRAKYSKFYLSVRHGINYDLKSDYSEKHDADFQINSNGAYFFTPNFGFGLNYHFNTGLKNFEKNIYDDHNYLVLEEKIQYNEARHYFGGDFYGRLYLGKPHAKQGYARRMTGATFSRWTLHAGVGIGCMWVNRYHRTYFMNYSVLSTPFITFSAIKDIMEQAIGFTASAGIHYRINPFVGIGLTADGLLGTYYDSLSGEDAAWKYHCVGISAGLDFYF